MQKIGRRAFLQTVGLAGTALASASCGLSVFSATGKITKGLPKKPNIIFILADDLGYGDVGCYGQKIIRTPCLDQMAAEGMRFTQHYAGATVCAPSRCNLMTGLHSGHALIRGNDDVALGPNDVTVAALLKKAGYTTGQVGKWGLSGLGGEGSPGMPTKQGFDYFYGYLDQTHAHNSYPAFLIRNEERVQLPNVVPKPGPYGEGVATVKVVNSNDLFTLEALDFIRRTKDQPFFLYLPYTVPHSNNQARRAGYPGLEVADLGEYKEKDWPGLAREYAAMITRMDGDIGKILALLRELGLDGKTLVMFSSDNGPHREGGNNPDFFDSNGPLRGLKRDLYDGGIRVPLIARWPGVVPAGSVTNHVSAFWDFLPTCCDLAGVPAPKRTDGISYLATLRDAPKLQKQHEYLYFEFHEQGGKQAVRMGDWKGIRLDVGREPNGPIELYNLKKDIGEEHNVAAQHPDIVARMAEIMRTARTNSPYFSFVNETK